MDKQTKIKFIQNFSEKHVLMKSPYFKGLLSFLGTGDKIGVRAGKDGLLDQPEIDYFDKICYLIRFYSSAALRSKIVEIIEKGVKAGSLEVLVFMGLGHKKAPMLVQNFLDRSSDLQTAAFVASYIEAFNS